jgi:small-conductance mechanosensitive channel
MGRSEMMLSWVYHENTVQAWLTASGIMFGTYVSLLLLRKVVLVRLQQLAERTSTQIDNMITDVLKRTGIWFTTYLSIYTGTRYLTLPEEADSVLRHLAVIVLSLQLAIWGHHLIAYWLVRFLRQRHSDDPGVQTMVGALGFIGRLVLFSALLLTALQNMDIKIDTLLAGLGIGGIAVALSVQSILGDLFASLSIVFDKPFLIGDFIILDNGMMGTVEHVGLKTTRVRSLTGEELVIANNDLLKTRIRNYRQMQNRLVNFTLGVTYQTSTAKLRRIPQIIKAIIDEHPSTAFEWADFSGFGTFSLDYDVAYYVRNYEWYSFMRIRGEIYLEILERFAEEGIEFAYPTQTVFVERAPTKEEQVEGDTGIM